MKYKDFKKMSQNEMKHVMGGYKLQNGCVWNHCPSWSYVSNSCPGGWAAIAVETCDSLPWPGMTGGDSCKCLNPS